MARTPRRKHPRAAPPAAGLADIRTEIDRIDAELEQLLNARARIAQAVGTTKRAAGTATAEFYRPEREAEVLRRVMARNRGPLSNEEMVRLFREIMSACLAQQEPLKIAFLGPEGTFTQQAVLKHFGHSVRALPLPAIDDVFREVESGVADFGVVPIENSTEGTVSHTADMFLLSPLKICGEVELRVHQHLIGWVDSLERIERICSHQQSLAQCRGWLSEHLPNVERIAVASNAEAARRARDEDGTAAIAGEAAAEVYGLKILVPEIEDRPDNATRFLIVGRKILEPSGRDRTTLLLSGPDTAGPGALLRLLEPFARHGISMSRLESRPSRRKKWDYVFFVDVEGHASDAPVAKALAEIKRRASLCKLLGSYPRAVL
ncbi:MAG TPA: prephenate dehydratase [Steroidobacteraceae bacterium]|nr:prephenate dehydratase [Steroidobacteraceae bacterium]